MIGGERRPTQGEGTGAQIAKVDQGAPVRLAALDSVRGLAAMIVVVHHCLLTQPAFSDFFFSGWRTPAHTRAEWLLFWTPAGLAWSGFEAVTLFYVLSGLVLALPWVEHRPPGYVAFCVKRVARIYLPYAVAVALAGVLNASLQPWAYVPAASNWVNTMTWTHPVTPVVIIDHAVMYGHRITVNGAVHSLTWEMRVSLLFPLLIWPITRFRALGAAAALGVILLLIAGLQYGFGEGLHAGAALLWSRPAHTLAGKAATEVQHTAYFACFFVLGAVLAINLRRIRDGLAAMPPAARLGLLALGLIGLQAHWSRIRAVQDGMVALGSALVLAAALAPGGIERVLLSRPLRFLGRISYSIYLVHVPLILTAVILLGAAPIIPLLLVILPAAIGVGWLFHRTVAEPCARLGQRAARRFEPRPASPVLATVGAD